MPKFYSIKNQIGGDRDLYLYGDIVSEKTPDWWTGQVSETDTDLKEFREAVEGLGNGQTLNIYINSGGGSVFAASTMVSMLRRAKERGAKIVSYIDGLAGSAASFFPMVADETHIYSNSMLMIHKPLGGIYGYCNADELEKVIAELNSVESGVMIPLYRDRSDLSEDEIIALLRAETWMNSAEIAETFNNITLHDEEKSAAACVSEYFKKYLHTPAALTSATIQNSVNQPVDYSEFENILKNL